MVINTSGLELGEEHTLVLESLDQASNGVESTLKTDTITVIVIEQSICEDHSLACFADNLATEVITSGEKAEWHLPQIIEGEKTLAEVTVLPDSLL